MVLELLLILIPIILLYFKIKNTLRLPPNAKYPRGPLSLPIIGGLYRIDKNDVIGSIDKLSKQYGGIFSLKFGSIDTVVLSDIAIIEKAYKDHSEIFNDRPTLQSFLLLGNGSNISFSKSIYWKKIRGILNNLLTASKTRSLEDFINQEYSKAELYLKKKLDQNNNIIEMVSFIKFFQINIVYKYIFGKSFEYDDDNKDTQALLNHLELNEEIVNYLGNQLSDFIPLLRLFSSHSSFASKLDKNIDFYRPFIQERINYMQSSKEPICLLDSIILEIKKEENSKVLDINFLEFIVFDLIVSSSDTTLSTFLWLLLYLVNNQDIQDKLNSELNSTNDYPLLKEKRNYVLFNSILKETQRLAPPVPYALPRQVNQDVVIEGYYIPKGTQILPNIYSVNHNSEQFKDPDSFNPYRYIDSISASASTSTSLKDLTFSTGPRCCPGISYAYNEVFLIATKLLKNFKFERTTDQKYDESGILNITFKPKPYMTKITLRNQNQNQN